MKRLLRICLTILVANWSAAALQAAQLGMRRPPLLLVEVWCSTDAQGRVSADQRTARLARPGSTQSGLHASWTAVLDQPRDPGMLLLAPLSWVDTPPTALRLFGAGRAQPPTMPGVASLPSAPTLATLQAAADGHLQAQASGLATGLLQMMQQAGADQAWLTYRQQVQFAGQAVQLHWNLHVLANGYWMAGTTQVQGAGTGTLKVRYVSKLAAQGLPVSYAYPDAGMLQWTVQDAQGQALGPAQFRDTGGAFDGPVGLGCLLGSALPAGGVTDGAAGSVGSAGQPVTCPSAWLSFSLPQLALRVSAARIELDYLDSLQPAFMAGIDGSRRALVSLQVDRTLLGHGRDCSRPPWQYRNVFLAAFRIQAQTRHFSRGSAGGWLPAPVTQSLVSGALSPWRDLTVPLQDAQRQQVTALLVDPERGLPVDLAQFSAGVPAVQVSTVRCEPQGP